jgi:hypothetical protein
VFKRGIEGSMKDIYHVIPLNDLKPHTESVNCKCVPSVQEGGKLIVHNSYDGREFFEESEQKGN